VSVLRSHRSVTGWSWQMSTGWKNTTGYWGCYHPGGERGTNTDI